ncbi:hypothetical protein P5673_029531 [Acropora cervicornis]|uniref:Uncharacterized protein n=1 Tax=Acropora cervicornis TaxID=6130 RepID=A0AAD9PVM8_ACRCE|nr:hypothetical protein P5673_029531 [Acropora cervicornis]
MNETYLLKLPLNLKTKTFTKVGKSYYVVSSENLGCVPLRTIYRKNILVTKVSGSRQDSYLQYAMTKFQMLSLELREFCHCGNVIMLRHDRKVQRGSVSEEVEPDMAVAKPKDNLKWRFPESKEWVMDDEELQRELNLKPQDVTLMSPCMTCG